jgi:hypothetical protein
MNITGILLVLLILLILTVILTLTTGNQTGGSPSGWSAITIPVTNNVYSQQFNELDNVDFVLKRQQVPGNEYINQLTGATDTERETQEVLPKQSLKDIKPATVSVDTKVRIETKQPYFFDDAMIVSYYGKPYYWDFRYPRQPIPVEFAKDPERFVRENPTEYPSYIIASRDYTNYQPNDPENGKL